MIIGLCLLSFKSNQHLIKKTIKLNIDNLNI